MATTKSTNPRNADLEAEVLKAAGNAPGPVDQQAVKEQAQEITGKAETMQGQPGESVQMPGSNLPPVATNTAAASVAPLGSSNQAIGNSEDPDYLEFLEYKKRKWVAEQLEGDRLSAEYQAKEAKEKLAEEAAKKAYQAVMSGQNETLGKVSDESEKTNLHEHRVKVYGDGYVVASRQGVEQVFTRQTWKLLGGRNNQDGYKEVVSTPPEVANLQKAQ